MLTFPLDNEPLNYDGHRFSDWDFTEVHGSNMSTYKSNRAGGKRKHATRDLYTEPLTEVKAMMHGKVLEVKNFYGGTHQVTVEHFYEIEDGTNVVFRYGELDKNSIVVKEGDIIKREKVLGKTGKLLNSDGYPILTLKKEDIYMLHLEMFKGTKGNNVKVDRLSSGNNIFKRRSDIFDPLDVFKKAFKNSFNKEL